MKVGSSKRQLSFRTLRVPLGALFIVLLTTNAAFVFANESIHRYTRGQDWTHGAQMSPTSSTYDAVEMPTASFSYTTLPSNGVVSWWVSSTTSGSTGVFAQVGVLYNGLSAGNYYAVGNGTTSEASGSAAFFYEYFDPTGACSGSRGCGNVVAIPSGWNAGDSVYYSISVYTSKNEISFQIYDYNAGAAINEYKCHDSKVVGIFSGNIAGVDESAYSSLNGGNTYVAHMALWAEVIGTGRNSGSASVYTQNGPNGLQPPAADNITINSANDFNLGWTSTGSHPTSGSLWSGSSSGSNEYVPPDGC